MKKRERKRLEKRRAELLPRHLELLEKLREVQSEAEMAVVAIENERVPIAQEIETITKELLGGH